MSPGWIRLFLLLLWIGTAGLLFLSTYVDPNTFTVLDWAINYEGGFVRRGLAGAALASVSEISGIASIHLIFITNLVLYSIFLGAAYLLIARLDFAPAFALLVFSPFFLTYQISSWPTAGRKEIALLAAFALLALTLAKTTSDRGTHQALTVFALVLPVLTLIHEGMFFFGVWALTAAYALGAVAQAPLRYVVLAVPSMLALIAALVWRGDPTIAAEICSSLHGKLGNTYLENACIAQDTAVVWLARATSDGLGSVSFFLRPLVVGLPAALLLIGLAFVPLWPALLALPDLVRRRLVLGAVGAVAVSIPLFFVAFDWGRFLAVHAICYALVVLMLLSRHPEALRRATWRPAVPVVLIYALFWSVQYKPIDLGTGYTSLIGGGYFVDYAIRLTR